jgi:hypothetical protein
MIEVNAALSSGIYDPDKYFFHAAKTAQHKIRLKNSWLTDDGEEGVNSDQSENDGNEKSAVGLRHMNSWFFRDFGYRKLDILINSCKQWFIVFVEKQKKFLRSVNENQILNACA